MEHKLILNQWDQSAIDFDRLKGLKQLIQTQKASLCSERAIFYTKVFKENEEKPFIIRKALAFAYTLDHMTLYVLDDSRIVGNMASTPFAAPLFFEYSIDWIVDEIETFEKRTGDIFFVSEEVKQDVLKHAPYWKNRTHQDNVKSTLSEQVKTAAKINVLHLGGISMSGDGHIVPDYPTLLSKGFRKYIQEVEDKLKQDGINQQSRNFYESTLIVLEAALRFFKRYGSYCYTLAQQETKPTRKQELLDMSLMMNRLMEQPAQSYVEALETVFLVHVLQMIESNGHSFCFGRFDQYMLPYYKKDIEKGVLTPELALEYTTEFFLMTNTLNKIRPNNHTTYSQGYPLYSNLMISGMNSDGSDSSNDVSYLCIEAMNLTALPHPNFSMRYHKKTPDDILNASALLIKQGFGMPAMFNDHVAIKGLIDLGIDVEDAYDYCAIGCVETGVPGKYGHRATGMTYMNWGKIVELLINNGTDINTNITMKKVDESQEQIISFDSFNDLTNGWRILLKFYTDLAVESDLICDQSLKVFDASPFASCFIDGCLEKGKTIKEGGSVYDVISQSNIGSSIVGNSLYTYKKLVFDDKTHTFKQIYDAISDNWQSLEAMKIRKDIMKLPKFGNDVDEVDYIVASVFDDYLALLPKYQTDRTNKGPKVSKYTMSTSNITSYVPNGLEVKATPDGRYAYEPLNEGCSPTQGTDVNGPTAVLKSVSKLPNNRVAAGQLLNMRFNPDALDGVYNFEKFKSLLRVSVDLGIYHNQFNVVDVNTLYKAKANPEHYQDLIVRVAGYCARFVSLMPQAQDAIIARTENQWG